MWTYRADVTREGRWWLITIPDLDGATQTRRVDDVEEMARSFISGYLDVAPSSFGVEVRFAPLGDVDMQRAIEQARQARASADEATAAYNQLVREVASALSKQGVTMRDVGSALNISHQRVQQILDGGKVRQ